MRLLVTRPDPDGAALAALLREFGHEPVPAPVMEIVPRKAALPLEGARALLLTSRNGARALAAATARRDLPVYAVGDSSAAEARRAGFVTVFSAAGDVSQLAALVAKSLEPKGGALIHAVGSAQAGDLAGMLKARGYEVSSVPLYESRPFAALPETASAALRAGRVDGALFYSPRTARLFGTLAAAADLTRALAPLTAYCLSAAVAEAAKAAGFARCAIAPEPNEGALLALIRA